LDRWRPIAAAASLLALTGCRFGAAPGATDQGRDMANLYHLFFYVAIVVGGITYALIIWSAIHYRRRRTDDDSLPRQTRYHIPLEVTYSIIPFLIVIGLFVATFRTEIRVDRVAANPAVEIRVTGFQWQWRFDYVGHAISIVGAPGHPPTMVVPVGQTIQIDLNAEDVIHSFYVPAFLFKRDAIPGVRNHFDITIPAPGLFRGECAEFCGLNHGDMTFYVQAVPVVQYRAWLTNVESP
jgi:cytochrome c oxidase subunit 2